MEPSRGEVHARLQRHTEERQVLDKGHVRLVDFMGDDWSIVKAARVSYGKVVDAKSRSDERAMQLIRYLMRHRHTSPMEMCEIKLDLKMPIFVARQWVRHRTASMNEVSGRYTELDMGYHVPEPEEFRVQSKTNKQGGSAADGDELRRFHVGFEASALQAEGRYHDALEAGMAREQARMVLPLSTYTRFIWKIDLHNLLHFLKLRLDPHAQVEIRAYADVISEIVQDWVPWTWRAFVDYQRDAVTLSKMEMNILRVLFQEGRFSFSEDLMHELTAFVNAFRTSRPGYFTEREAREFLATLTGGVR